MAAFFKLNDNNNDNNNNMKKNYSILVALLLTASIFFTQQATAQAPQKMSYQSVLRNSSNALLANTAVGMQISILQGSDAGTAVYVETQTATTNTSGLVNVQIGTGTATTGTFAGIDWANGPYFIKTETDPAGGSNYNITGIQQMLSVPYALYAAHSNEPGIQGPPGLTGAIGPQGPQGLTGASGVAGTSEGVGGFTHYIGETFDGGIIYYLYKGSDGLEHGLMVSPTQSSLAWQTSALQGTVVNADRTWDGAYNTALMIGSPAAAYVTSLGSGWYVPSIDELVLLISNRYAVNKTLIASGNPTIATLSTYWSSTVRNYQYPQNLVYIYKAKSGISVTFETNANLVRGVKAF